MARFNITVSTPDGVTDTVVVDAPNAAQARRLALRQSVLGAETGARVGAVVPIPDAPVQPEPTAERESTVLSEYFLPDALTPTDPTPQTPQTTHTTTTPTPPTPPTPPEPMISDVFGETVDPQSFTAFTNGATPPTPPEPPTPPDPEPFDMTSIPFGGLSAADLEGISPTAAVRSAIGNVFGEQPGTQGGPISSFLRRQAFNLIPAQQLGALANIARGGSTSTGTGTNFEDYLRNLAGQSTGLRGGFQQALDDVNFLRGLEAGSPGFRSDLFAPGEAAQTADALNFLGAAQQARYSPFVSSIFRQPTQEQIFADYVLDSDTRAREGQAARNFLDFAAGRFGL